MSSAVKKSFSLFSLRTMKRYPELLPLVCITGFAATMCTGYMAYSAYKKSDVMFFRSSRAFPWDSVDPEEKQKIVTRTQEYNRIPEKEQLYKEIGAYKF